VNDNADEMRRMYDSALRARGSVRAGAAVSLERILDLVEGRGGEEERLATLDAVMADEESAKEFELLRSLAANRPATRATWARRSYIVLCLAAAAAVLVVAAPVMRSAFNRPTESPARSGAQAAVPLLPPIEASQRTSRRFVWRPVAGARSYVVEVLTAAGTPVFTTHTADTTMTLPADVRLEPGLEYRWWVSSELLDGTQRRSAFRRLIVRDAK